MRPPRCVCNRIAVSINKLRYSRHGDCARKRNVVSSSKVWRDSPATALISVTGCPPAARSACSNMENSFTARPPPCLLAYFYRPHASRALRMFEESVEEQKAEGKKQKAENNKTILSGFGLTAYCLLPSAFSFPNAASSFSWMPPK